MGHLASISPRQLFPIYNYVVKASRSILAEMDPQMKPTHCSMMRSLLRTGNARGGDGPSCCDQASDYTLDMRDEERAMLS